MPAEARGAIKSIVTWQAVENGVEIRRIIVHTGPATARHRSFERREAEPRVHAEERDLLFSESLRVRIGIAGRKDVLRRADQGNSPYVRAQVDRALHVQADRVHIQASTGIGWPAQSNHRVT